MLERFNSNEGECDIRAKLLMSIERLCVNQGNPWRWSNILVISPGGRSHSWLKYSTLNSLNGFIERILHYIYLYLFELHNSLAPFRASLVRFLLRITTSAVATVSPVLCLPFPHFFAYHRLPQYGQGPSGMLFSILLVAFSTFALTMLKWITDISSAQSGVVVYKVLTS